MVNTAGPVFMMTSSFGDEAEDADFAGSVISSETSLDI